MVDDLGNHLETLVNLFNSLISQSVIQPGKLEELLEHGTIDLQESYPEYKLISLSAEKIHLGWHLVVETIYGLHKFYYM